MPPLKLAFIGNQGNNAYKLCKWSRAAGVDAELFMFSAQPPERSLPELVDTELAHGYPAWITVLDGKRDVFHDYAEYRNRLEQDTHVIITSGSRAIYELHQFSRPRLFHVSLGGDIGQLPWVDPETLPNPGARRRQALYRETISRFEGIFTQFPPTIAALKAAGLGDQLVEWAFPEDVEANRQRMDGQLASTLAARYDVYDRVFMWLSRQVTDRSTFGCKRADVFIDAAARFVRERPGYRLRLILGNHGADRAEIRARVEQSGLADYVDWVEHQPYHRLLAYLALPKAVVFDEQAPETAEVSGMARDALTMGCACVKSLDYVRVAKLFGPGCPILSSTSTEECLGRMLALSNDDVLRTVQRHSETWAAAYLHYPRNLATFLMRVQTDAPATRWP